MTVLQLQESMDNYLSTAPDQASDSSFSGDNNWGDSGLPSTFDGVLDMGEGVVLNAGEDKKDGFAARLDGAEGNGAAQEYTSRTTARTRMRPRPTSMA